MSKITVRTPVPGVNKTIAGVDFSNGVGKVDSDNRSAISYFRRHGYPMGSEAPEGDTLNGNLAPDGTGGGVALGEMSIPEMRAYAKQHNIDIKGHNTKVDIRNAIEVALTADQASPAETPVTSQAGDPDAAPEQPKQEQDGAPA